MYIKAMDNRREFQVGIALELKKEAIVFFEYNPARKSI